jgi:sugar phosphate isomerase/epimerase
MSPRSLATSWSAHRFDDGMALAREVREMGFSSIQLSAGTPGHLIPGLMQAVERGIVTVSSARGPLHASDSAPSLAAADHTIRQAAMRATAEDIATAARCGAGVFILSPGSAMARRRSATLERMAASGGLHSRPYVAEKLRLVAERRAASTAAIKAARHSLRELLRIAGDHGVRIAIETPALYEQVPCVEELDSLLADSSAPALAGVWHDFGHIQRQANLGFLDHADFLRSIAGRVAGCQIHDVDWPCHEHLLPGTGGVDWGALLPLLPADIPMAWDIERRERRLRIKAALETRPGA